jgi:hypothetical protein
VPLYLASFPVFEFINTCGNFGWTQPLLEVHAKKMQLFTLSTLG